MKRWEGFQHGINLGGWLSQCDHTKERYDNFIKEEDINNWTEDVIESLKKKIGEEIENTTSINMTSVDISIKSKGK